MQKKHIGNKGEDLAVYYLLRNDYTILKRNWRSSPYEIDIIALLDKTLHFIEVKTTTNPLQSTYDQYFKEKQLSNIIKAADVFIQKHGSRFHTQIDIILIYDRLCSSTVIHKENVLIPGVIF